MKVDNSGLSVKESVVVRQILQGDCAKDSLLAAGYSESVATTASSRIVSRPSVQNALREALERAGVTIDKIAQTAANGLEANKPIVVDKCIEEYPDHSTRHKFLETVVKLSGLEPAASISIDADTYESRMMQVISQTQTIDSPNIAQVGDNSLTIIEANLVPENDEKSNIDKDYQNTGDSDSGAGI